MKIPENTSTFTYYNANPKNKRTSDCVIRAICTALNQDYYQTVKELTEIWIKTGYCITDIKCFGKYLELKGWIKNKQPRKPNNTKYTEKEFAKKFNGTCIANIDGHHIICIINNKIQNKMHKLASLASQASVLDREINEYFEEKGYDIDALRSGDGTTLDELNYGNDITDIFIEDMVNDYYECCRDKE